MSPEPPLAASDLEHLRRLDTCSAANAIERFNVRLRNEGFIHGSIRCLFPDLPPMLGYAVTGRIHTSAPPMTGGWYYDRLDWWTHVLTVPAPRVLILQDADRQPGIGAFVGEIHAHIALALNCVGCVTNGASRDLPAVKALGFPVFAGSVAVSHAYAHIIEFGEPVEIGGLRIQPGDLIHGDLHGVHTIPRAIAAEIPAVAAAVLAEERSLIELCRSGDFSLERLAALLRQTESTRQNLGKLQPHADK